MTSLELMLFIPVGCRVGCCGLSSTEATAHVGLFACWRLDWTQCAGLGAKLRKHPPSGRVWCGLSDVCHWIGIQFAQAEVHEKACVWIGCTPGGDDHGVFNNELFAFK